MKNENDNEKVASITKNNSVRTKMTLTVDGAIDQTDEFGL